MILQHSRSGLIEGVVLGRNDDYEPDWHGRLKASLAYNRRLFEQAGIDYRVAFVEWNPPAGRPLLGPDLVARFPFLRAIVIDAMVHQRLCQAQNLSMMLNFPYNSALRTSAADYCLITSGDLFFGRALVAEIAKGLASGCLYRAERVNIRANLPFATATPLMIEDPDVIEQVDTCSEPPYNVPPYTNASGDFLMVDRATMTGLRGFDESVLNARLHLDSRFCVTAMAAQLDCRLLGRIFHINHGNSYRNRGSDYPGERYDHEDGLPYLNPPSWGLAEYAWLPLSERLWRVSLPETPGGVRLPADMAPAVAQAADRVTRRLAEIRRTLQPKRPAPGHVEVAATYSPVAFKAYPYWHGATVEPAPGQAATITTSRAPWGNSAILDLEGAVPETQDGTWRWVKLIIGQLSGEVAVSIVRGEDILVQTLSAESRHTLWLRTPPGSQAILVRNGEQAGPSRLEIESVELLSQASA